MAQRRFEHVNTNGPLRRLVELFLSGQHGQLQYSSRTAKVVTKLQFRPHWSKHISTIQYTSNNTEGDQQEVTCIGSGHRVTQDGLICLPSKQSEQNMISSCFQNSCQKQNRLSLRRETREQSREKTQESDT